MAENSALEAIVSRAVESLVDSEALPKERDTATSCAVLTLFALVDEYSSRSSPLTKELHHLGTALLCSADPLVIALGPVANLTLRSVLTNLRQQRKQTYGQGKELDEDGEPTSVPSNATVASAG